MSQNTKIPNLFPGLENLTAAWMSALSPSSGASGSPGDVLAQLLDPRHWLGVGGAALEQPFEAILGLPRLADVPAFDRKLLALFQDWMTVAQRSGEFNALVGQVWLQAYQTFLADLQSAAVEGKTVQSGRDLIERWTATANATLLQAQRQGEFLAAQRRLLEAILSSRLKEREIVEAQAEALGLPTRTEMDDVHRTLQEVKRELRALKRQLAAEAVAKEAPPRPQASPVRAAAKA